MILLSCKLFLRKEEVSSIKYSSFNKDISLIWNNGNVEALAVEIQGKSDNEIVILQLWRDDINPELCPIKHLLVFVHLSGSNSGYLFPKKSAL